MCSSEPGSEEIHSWRNSPAAGIGCIPIHQPMITDKPRAEGSDLMALNVVYRDADLGPTRRFEFQLHRISERVGRRLTPLENAHGAGDGNLDGAFPQRLP